MSHGGAPKKRQRVISTASTPRVSSSTTSSAKPSILRRSFSHPHSLSAAVSTAPTATTSAPTNFIFNDSATADVILRLLSESPDLQLHLHSSVLRRSQYFATLLSDRWRTDDNSENGVVRVSYGVSSITGSVDTYVTVLQLLYSDDFANVIDSASVALDILPVALELLFEDCVKACVRFLECVPWSEEEERRVIDVVPFLNEEESRELVARVLPVSRDSCEEMLNGLILQAINNYPNVAFVKAFVAKLLRDFSSRECAKRVLEKVFRLSLKIVRESMEEYSSPDFRGDHNETEAIQRLNLHTAMTNGRHLLWLVERMIELRVADGAVKEWSEQENFTADLQRAFRDDAWRNIVPGLPAVVLRCTYKLANAVAAGTILAERQVLN